MRDSIKTARSILEAAERVILEKGINRLTLEEIARYASVSKGAVLHHYPNKEAVLLGLFEALVARFEADIERFRQEDTENRGSFTRAYLRATLNPDARCASVFGALSPALNEMPALLALRKNSHTRWQHQVEQDGINPVDASIVRLAADGLRLAQIRQMEAPADELRQRIVSALLSLTEGKI